MVKTNIDGVISKKGLFRSIFGAFSTMVQYIVYHVSFVEFRGSSEDVNHTGNISGSSICDLTYYYY